MTRDTNNKKLTKKELEKENKALKEKIEKLEEDNLRLRSYVCYLLKGVKR